VYQFSTIQDSQDSCRGNDVVGPEWREQPSRTSFFHKLHILSFFSNDADSPEHEQTSQSGGTRAPCRFDVFTIGAAAQGSASRFFDQAISPLSFLLLEKPQFVKPILCLEGENPTSSSGTPLFLPLNYFLSFFLAFFLSFIFKLRVQYWP